MNRFQKHLTNIISYDNIIKNNYINLYQNPVFKKITISLNSISLACNEKELPCYLMALLLITGQESTKTVSRKNKIHLKIKKGNIVGVKLTLNKKNNLNFLENIILFILPIKKDFKGFTLNKKNKNIVTFSLDILDILNFLELKNEYLSFSQIPNILVNIELDSKNINDSFFFFNSFNFPVIIK